MVLPAGVRERLGLRGGDKLALSTIERGGAVCCLILTKADALADATVDVVISNCVINLSPDRPRVFREVHRVLRPRGRIVVSDLVLLRELPAAVRESLEA